MSKIKYVFMVIICVFIVCGCEKIELNGPTTTTATTMVTTTNSSNGQKPGCYVDYEDYINVYAEMTYAEVVRIIGCDGILQTSATIRGDKHESYYWYGKSNEQVLSVSFMNGVVNGYTQSNLDVGVDTSQYAKTTKKVEPDPDAPLTDAEKKALGIE